MHKEKPIKTFSAGLPLSVKFSLYVFLIIILVSFIHFFVSYKNQKIRHLSELKEEGLIIGRQIASSVPNLIASHNYLAMEKVVKEIGEYEGVKYVGILAANEQCIAAWINDLDDESLSNLQRPSDAFVHHDILLDFRKIAGSWVDISVPVVYTDKYLGRVIVGMSFKSGVDKTNTFLLRQFLINGLMALLLAGAIYLFFWKKILVPIYRLNHAAKRMAEGDLSRPVEVVGNDEISRVSTSFNEMMLARKKAEDISRETQKNWERLFNAVDDLVTIQDPEMKILQANRAAGNILEKDSSELVGKYCYQVFKCGDTACENCPGPKTFSDEKPHSMDIEYKNLNKTFHLSTFPIFDEKGKCSKLACIARDMTEAKHLEAQYRQAQKMEAIGTLAGGIAHDFNNILTPIVGYAEMIAVEAEAGSKLEMEINQIIKASRLAKQLVSQILTFSRPRTPEIQKLYLQPLIKDILKLMRSSVPTTILFDQMIDPACAPVMADLTQVHQVIMNICTNAYHAMEKEGGTLSVNCYQVYVDSEKSRFLNNIPKGNYALIKIEDTGTGIDQKSLEHIFEPFFTTKEEGKGTGMGLSVTHRIVSDHGGTITVSSEPGKGSIFCVYLPCVETVHVAESEQEKKGDKVDSTGNEHLMVVDDSSDVLELETLVLEQSGYRVSSYEESAKALEVLQSHPNDFSLVITDMTMPKPTGLDLANEILKISPDLPIILCTGYTNIDIEVINNHPSIKAFLQKPLQLSNFLKTVREVLDEGKSHE
ncbi:MAG: hypothetical protein CR997_13980 [Acidobacteria bacterium]|nr:MAG: hypothetical protein CR997_13980 [Acidobacteriota bacterium]